MEENRLLSQSQFGFRLKRSTSTALIAFTDQVLESMDKGCVTGTVFLDLRKAFDTVDHIVLINKLKSLGVARKSLEWLRSYLYGRVQQSMCVNALSPSAKITMVVPQGSILGPLLFLVYINGIQSELQHSELFFKCKFSLVTTVLSKREISIKNHNGILLFEFLKNASLTHRAS